MEPGRRRLPLPLPLLLLVLHVGVSRAGKEYSLPYPTQPQKCKDPNSEYWEDSLKKCCSKCSPGYHLLQSCNSSVDTQCAPCKHNTFTAKWNKLRQCRGCLPPCGKEFVQSQECTRTHDRICICSANTYCATDKSKGQCLVCKPHKTCAKGYGVSKAGELKLQTTKMFVVLEKVMADTLNTFLDVVTYTLTENKFPFLAPLVDICGTESMNTECAPCPPGMFSDEESSTTPCKQHRVCQSVSVQGNNTSDTVCSESEAVTSSLTTTSSTGQIPAQSQTSKTPEISTKAVHLGTFADVSTTIGIIVGLTFVGLLAFVGIFCLIASRKRGTDLTFLAPEKQPDKRQQGSGAQSSKGPEQEEQLLLETPGSSSNSWDKPSPRINEISIKNTEKKETERTQQRWVNSDGCKHHNGVRPNSASSEHSSNGGTQVNVTCIVNVCNSNHNPQSPEQTASTTMDYENVSCCTPTEEEIPLSKEENPLKRESEIQIVVEAEDSLPPNSVFPEGKPFPLSVQDVGMKTS